MVRRGGELHNCNRMCICIQCNTVNGPVERAKESVKTEGRIKSILETKQVNGN